MLSEEAGERPSSMEEEFDEEEVWATIMEKGGDGPKTGKKKGTSFTSHCSSAHMPGSNMVAEQIRQSSPVNIPRLSKVYKGRTSSEAAGGGRDTDGEEDDEEEEGGLPPHELLARKMERSRISSSSVCEGAGRTLKGRDQCKVRDAVLSKTGFLE